MLCYAFFLHWQKSKKISKKVIGYDRDIKVRKKCAKLKFLDSIIHNLDLYENYD